MSQDAKHLNIRFSAELWERLSRYVLECKVSGHPTSINQIIVRAATEWLDREETQH